MSEKIKPRYNYPILRKGGSHRKSRKNERQKSKREISNELTNTRADRDMEIKRRDDR